MTALELLKWVAELIYEFRRIVIEFVALLVIWFLLKRERKKLEAVLNGMQERIDTLGQQIRAVQETVEEAPAQIDQGANWERVRSLWQNVRDRIELLINQIPNRNVRRKYSNFRRYSYQGIITALLQDGRIHPQTAAGLLNMNSSFLTLRRRPNNISPAEAQQFEAWYQQVDGDLPALPQEAEQPANE